MDVVALGGLEPVGAPEVGGFLEDYYVDLEALSDEKGRHEDVRADVKKGHDRTRFGLTSAGERISVRDGEPLAGLGRPGCRSDLIGHPAILTAKVVAQDRIDLSSRFTKGGRQQIARHFLPRFCVGIEGDDPGLQALQPEESCPAYAHGQGACRRGQQARQPRLAMLGLFGRLGFRGRGTGHWPIFLVSRRKYNRRAVAVDRITFIPAWIYSPAVCEQIPALRALLDDLGRSFDVKVFSTPSAKQAERPAVEWQAVVRELEREISPGSHVVAMSSTAAVSLLAIAEIEVGSFTAAGISLPAATMRGLGRTDVAIATGAESRFLQNAQNILQQVMRGADDYELTRYAAILNEEIDWDHLSALRVSLDEIDLSKHSLDVRTPVLYLSAAAESATSIELAEVFCRFVPGAQVQPLKAWPNRLQYRDAGYQLSARVKTFIHGLEDGVAERRAEYHSEEPPSA